MANQAWVRGLFPSAGDATIESPESRRYNCVAWAIGDTGRWWWPDIDEKAYWPNGLARGDNLDTFIAAFVALGYEECESDDLEGGIEKITIYANAEGRPTHVAKQLETGRWTSKLGKGPDIEHETPQSLSGDAYGTIAFNMGRPQEHE